MKQILDDAAGEACPSYQGHERFWNLPIQELLNLSLYGVRLIAPVAAPAANPFAMAPAAKSCCSTPEPAPAPVAAPTPGRGEASGLIRGLRGLAPFDGTQFPPLPWGGTRVSLDDIAFISAWIDDGCPMTDAPAKGLSEQAQSRSLALCEGRGEHAQCGLPSNVFRNQGATAKIRKNVEFLTDEELARFRAAIRKMKSYDEFRQDERSFGYWARIHANQCQHAWEQFLTWHRAYLYFFELELQKIDPTVTLPYWDWAAMRENVETSIADAGTPDKKDNGVVPKAYRCWIDDAGIGALRAAGVPEETLAKLDGIKGKEYDSGNRLFIAANIQWGLNPASDQAIVKQLEEINPLWHFSRWPGGDKTLIFEVWPTPEDVANILELDDFFAFASGPEDNHFFGALENIHNLIHNFTGGDNPNPFDPANPLDIKNPKNGDMVNSGRTAFDPIFWGHHANCDRLWSEWQKKHPNGTPNDPDDMLSPWPMVVKDTLSISKLGYEYLQSSHVFRSAASDSTVTRFLSAKAEVPAKVVATHRRAEVRLHRVRYVTRAGFFIRVFLNLPYADETTPTTGNPNYVGVVSMFTGLCIGGPGHCETPSPTQSQFNRNPRNHKTPANFRVDATAAVARLRDAGATDFHVNLVVLNSDGSAASDALHFDGVSLNFMD